LSAAGRLIGKQARLSVEQGCATKQRAFGTVTRTALDANCVSGNILRGEGVLKKTYGDVYRHQWFCADAVDYD